MSIEHFTGTVWSESLLKSLSEKYVGVANCFRDFEGEIKEKGSVVRMCGLSDISIKNYTPNADMDGAEELVSFSRDIVIDQAKYFNFQIDDVDQAQAVPKVMDLALQNAADCLAKEADKYVYGLWRAADYSHIITDTTATVQDILEKLLDVRKLLMENGVTNPSDIVIEVPPRIANMILQAKLHTATENKEYLEAGCLGSLFGCKLYVSNNIEVEMVDGAPYYKCFVRSKRAIAFAEQISKVVAYTPEKRFSDAIKGLHLYGAKIIYPDEFYVFDVAL
jgi:hypothetical protein